MARTPHYWFNRRNLGQLLVPVTWQAFVLIAVQSVILVGGLKVVLDADSTSATIGYCALFGFLMFLTFAVAISKSPMPRSLRRAWFD